MIIHQSKRPRYLSNAACLCPAHPLVRKVLTCYSITAHKSCTLRHRCISQRSLTVIAGVYTARLGDAFNKIALATCTQEGLMPDLHAQLRIVCRSSDSAHAVLLTVIFLVVLLCIMPICSWRKICDNWLAMLLSLLLDHGFCCSFLFRAVVPNCRLVLRLALLKCWIMLLEEDLHSHQKASPC